MTDAPKCEPPPSLREATGWHWIEMLGYHQMPVCWKYWKDTGDWRWIGHHGASVAPDIETAQRWRYLAPAYAPDDVAALVKAARNALLRLPATGLRRTTTDLTIAIAPFGDET